MIVYIHLDEVIRIIREYDDAKERMMKKWKLSDVQAEAILNLRLRALRKLEEIEIKKELAALTAEEKEKNALLKDEKQQWSVITDEIHALRKEFGPTTRLGKRRTEIGAPPADIEVPAEALVEREPVTVLCSAKGWIRAVKGHGLAHEEMKYKEDDEARFAIETLHHRQAFDVREQWALLHPRCRQAAGRARPWRADPPHDRSRQ